MDTPVEPIQQQADLGVTDSGGETQAPPAADQGDFSFTKTLHSLKAQGFRDARAGHPWEHLARAFGFSDEELAETIAAPEFPISKCVAPNGAILKAKDFLTRAKRLTEICDEEPDEESPRHESQFATDGPLKALPISVCLVAGA